MKVILLLIVSVLLSIVNANVPECASSLHYWDTYENLSNCLRSNPVSELKKGYALTSLKLAVENYAFFDIIKSPPDLKVAQPVDLLKNLNLVEKTVFANDAELQQGLADAFIPLRDAHTRYNKPQPYAASFFVQPFRYDAIVDDSNTQRIILRYSPSDMSVYNTLYGSSPVPDSLGSVDGWEIISMNGRDAISTFSDEVDVGTCKDSGARFNLAVNGYGDTKGYYGWRAMGRYGIPESKSIVYVVAPTGQSKKTSTHVSITVNWMGLYQNAVPDVASAVSNALSPKLSSAGVSKKLLQGKVEQEMPDDIQVRLKMHDHYHPQILKSMGLSSSLPSISLNGLNMSHVGNVPAVDPSGVSYADFSDDVGILRVSTFSPTDYPLFRSRVVQAMKNFSSTPKGKSGEKKLIIDLRANGGGSICLGYGLNRYLFPSTSVQTSGHGPHSMARYDMKKSNLLASMTTEAAKNPADLTGCGEETENFFTPCFWYSADSDARSIAHNSDIMNTNDDWMNADAVSRVRGGVESEYSSLFHEGCEEEYNAWAPPGAGFDDGHHHLTSDNVMLLSDGLCGSTCAVFSSSVQLTGLAKTAVIGGLQDKEQSFWSFPGGQVVTIEFLVATASELSLMRSPYLPSILPDGATFRFALREIYPWDTPYMLGGKNPVHNNFLPLEFVFVPADYHLNYKNAFSDSVSIYDQVVALMTTSCPSKGFRSPNSNACAVCPPGSLANSAKDGCVCGYGEWSRKYESCEWGRVI